MMNPNNTQKFTYGQMQAALAFLDKNASDAGSQAVMKRLQEGSADMGTLTLAVLLQQEALGDGGSDVIAAYLSATDDPKVDPTSRTVNLTVMQKWVSDNPDVVAAGGNGSSSGTLDLAAAAESVSETLAEQKPPECRRTRRLQNSSSNASDTEVGANGSTDELDYDVEEEEEEDDYEDCVPAVQRADGAEQTRMAGVLFLVLGFLFSH